MPRHKIARSLYEPVTIEVEGGRTYESVPLSPFLIREIAKLEEQRKAKTIDEFSGLTQQVALIFGIDSKEVETIDIRVLNEILELAGDAMATGPKKPVPLDTMTVEKATATVIPSSEALAEKNESKPGSEITP
jgi:hypothetical protein